MYIYIYIEIDNVTWPLENSVINLTVTIYLAE